MDAIEVTEKQRQQLEASVAKLRKALKHWQIQSAEYEGLKEELLSLPKTAGRDKILAIADDFGGDVVTRAEITSFLGDKEGIKRGPAQVAEAVRHRIDYIQENIDKIEKQLEIGEATLDNVRIIKNSGQLTNEEGLAVMDIREDLDERGVVIKSDVNPAAGGSAKPFNITAAIESFQPLVDTLSKKQKEKEKSEATKPQEKSKTASSTASKSTPSKQPTSEKKPPSQDAIQQKSKPKVQPKTPKRIQSTEKEYSAQTGMVLTEKRVKAKLVPDIKEEAPQAATREEVSVREIISAIPEPASYMNTLEQANPGTPQKEGIARIRVLDDSDDDLDEDSEDPFNSLPTVEESEEDAQMREEMIKYNMREMNNIVAEIELEEDDEEDDDEDYDDEEDEADDNEEEDEDEDQWGRSKGRLVSDKVRREMMKLQKKIEARDKAAQVAAEVEEDSKALAANTEKNKEIASPAEEPKKKKKSSEKKGVRFAEELDIAPAPTPISKPPSNASELIGNEFDDEDIDPSILDMIFGPGTADQEARYFQNTTEQPKKKLPSLFRAARQVQKAKEQSAIEKAPPAISGVVEKVPPPPGSYEIIEREPSTTTPTAPKPSGKMPTRKTTPSKATAEQSQKEPTPETSAILDPLGAELSDEDRPIMAASVIERAPTWEAPSTIGRAPPTAPDELDPEFHQREVTNAYYSMRNKLIQRQGGYVETEEEKMEVPIDGNLEKKKVSRFKAGRVKNQMP
ncbi:hypothetical protein TWF225_002163 [Orbilia oligospora]|nr:hypothetical protein TWF225_002163 [Orbilia oligospora]KAF3242624.1 hypothetical protein TWF217_011484 [Orbilia oligospora]KAF3257986.1 hypothetical protein TWF128_004885 [Orbilia oligospora]KAF3286363.1 hypothetical protein TWF132_008934 [Orbilia oligospora]